MKRNKLVTKIHDLVNNEEINKIDKQIEEIEKSEDVSSRIFKAIKDLNEMKPLNKMKPKTTLIIKQGDQYTANKKQQAKLITKHFQIKICNHYQK